MQWRGVRRYTVERGGVSLGETIGLRTKGLKLSSKSLLEKGV